MTPAERRVLRPEEEADVEVGGGFGDDFFDASAMLPPAVSGIFLRRSGNDPNFNVRSEGFLKQETAAASVNSIGQDI